MNNRRVLLAAIVAIGSVCFAAEKPKSVIHVVTVKWKPGTEPAKITAALKAAEQLADQYKGITRIWTRAIKVQGDGYTHAIVMEFRDEKALTDYADSPEQKKWYEVYLPIREESTTHDITN